MSKTIWWVRHEQSGSQSFVEFNKKNGKVRIAGVAFASGNVISLPAVKEAMRRATEAGLWLD